MVTKHKYKNIVWIDLESPKEEEVVPLAKEFSLSSSIIEELRRPSERAKADPHGKYIYLIFHLPKYRHKEERETTQEIDFIIGKDFIITSHYEPIDLFLDVSKLLETKSILDKSDNFDNSGLIFYYIMKSFYGSLEYELDHIRRDLALAEKEIFIGNEGKMVHVLSKINKALIDFRHPLKAHHEILESLETKEGKLFGDSHGHHTEMVIGEYKKVWGRMENNRDLLMDLRDTNDSLFAAKTNNIMKNLTIMSFLTFPLTLMTGIFGMNAVNIPLVGNENGFWIILGIMAGTALFMVGLFKYKRWI
jgi:magnesium transporter